MRISENIARIQREWGSPNVTGEGALVELSDFGPNPGNLKALYYVPSTVCPSMPMVVVLHGCTQTAAGYDHGSGWSKLADRLGIIVLFPEQRRQNNPNLCFNWFQAGDTRRGEGEAASIHQMIEKLSADFPIDRARIFCTGLSAGGAMTSVMLATYPDVFAAGAIIAGLPFSGASNVGEAFALMNGGKRLPAAAAAKIVRKASRHSGPWPRVSVWHGTADATVAATNSDDIVNQWLALHGLSTRPSSEVEVDGYPHRTWLGADGQSIVEQYILTGMGHGTPLAPGTEDGQSGVAGAHMLNVGISSTDRIAEFFGIGRAPSSRRSQKPRVIASEAGSSSKAHVAGVQQVIENALRAAGLMQ